VDQLRISILSGGTKKVPQLFVLTGSNGLINPKKFPYTVPSASSYALEAIFSVNMCPRRTGVATPLGPRGIPPLSS